MTGYECALTMEILSSMKGKKREPYESLYEYRLAKKLADMAWISVGNWPVFERRETGEQLIRAADSLRMNVERSLTPPSAFTGREFARKARSSLFEIRHLLKKAFRSGILNEDEADEFLLVIESLGPRINRLVDLLGTGGRLTE